MNCLIIYRLVLANKCDSDGSSSRLEVWNAVGSSGRKNTWLGSEISSSHAEIRRSVITTLHTCLGVRGALRYCCSRKGRRNRVRSRVLASPARLSCSSPSTHVPPPGHNSSASYITNVTISTDRDPHPLLVRHRAVQPSWPSTGTSSARHSATTQDQNSPSMRSASSLRKDRPTLISWYVLHRSSEMVMMWRAAFFD